MLTVSEKKRYYSKDRLSFPALHDLSPCSYNVPNDPSYMTQAPCYTFRQKTKLDKLGSYDNVWFNKCRKPSAKPSPAQYNLPKSIGQESACFKKQPSHTMNGRPSFMLTRKGVEDEPSPTSYNLNSYKPFDILKRPITSKTIPRDKETRKSWLPKEHVPGPGSYRTISPVKRQRNTGYTFSKTPRSFDYQKALHTF